jgi:protein TonB
MRVLPLALIIALGAAHQTDAADPLPRVKTRPNSQLPTQEMPVIGSRSQFDVPPKFISGTAPIYPITRLRLREPGYAFIRFTVDENGRTRDFQVMKTNYPFFASHAIVAIEKWRFQPARKNGHPVSCRIQTPFYYRVGR